MAYHIYQTEAFVLDDYASGEANKIYFLLTPDLGRIVVKAQGVRLLKSKLRFHLDRYSFVLVSVVRGKDSWRLVGVDTLPILKHGLSAMKFKMMAQSSLLLSRFIRGEGEQNILFGDFKKALVFLSELEEERLFAGWDLAIALRIFYRLGYIGREKDLDNLLLFKDWSIPVLEEALRHRRVIITAVNAATQASHI